MKAKIEVKGMHCTSCEVLLTDSLQEIAGVNKVKVDHKKGEVEVDFDESKVNIGAIKLAIIKEGYNVK
ncbi:MAG: heavy-metal-associated domain-containing protein [archaeon]